MKNGERDTTLDIARGLAIVAIVLGHVLRGLVAAGIIDQSNSNFLLTDRALYLVHLSVFVFVAGLFLSSGVDRRGVAGYLRPRISLFLYLYVVWSILQGLVKVATSALVNSPVSIGEIFQLWLPAGQLWYLPFLIVVTSLFALGRVWRTRPLSIISIAIAVAVSVLCWGLNGSFVGTQGFGLTAFFAAGVLVGSARYIRASRGMSHFFHVGLTGLSAVVFVGLLLATNPTPPSTGGDVRTIASIVFGMAASMAGLLLTLELSRAVSFFAPLSKLFQFLGERSLEIFLAHIVAASGTRIVLSTIGITNATVHIFMGLAIGVGAPLLLWSAVSRVGIRGVFDLPGHQARVFEQKKDLGTATRQTS